MNPKHLSLRLALVAASLLAVSACSMGDSEAELIASGKAKLAQKDYKAAAIEFKNALGKNPESGEARLMLGRVLLISGDAAGAQLELRKALEAQVPARQVIPELARAMLAHGDAALVISQFATENLDDPEAVADLKTTLAAAHASKGDMDMARGSLTAALSARPGYAEAVLMKAKMDVLAGQTDAALAELTKLLSAEPGHEAAGLMKAQFLMGTDGARALGVLRQVQTSNPGSVVIQAAIVDALNRQNQVAEAKSEFAKLQKLSPEHQETLNLQAQFAFADKDYKGSLEIAERLLAARPNLYSVLVMAGAAHLRLQQYTQAEGKLGRAVTLDPQSATARHLLARSFLGSGRPEKAIELLQPQTDAEKPDATSLALIGEAHLLAGEGKRAEAAFRTALKVAPEDAALRTAVAAAQYAQGNEQAAVSQFEAIAKGDTGTRADLALISARMQQSNFPSALKAIEALEKKTPKDAVPAMLRGRVLFLMGNKPGAVTAYQMALERQPGYLPAVARLAAMDFDAGRTDQARQRFKDIIKSNPRNTRARLALVDMDSQLGTPEPAILAQLRDAAKADGSNPMPHLALVDRLQRNGDAPGALAAAQEATSALPNDLEVMEALGRTQLAAGDSQRAVSTFKKLTSLQPKNPNYLVLLADAFQTSQDRDSAARTLRQAVELEPDHLPALRAQALQATLDKRPQEALGIARAMQQRNPKSAAGFELEGDIEANRLNWPAAALAFNAALQRGKSVALAMKFHRSLSEGGRADEAGRFAAEWRKANPADTVFIYYLGERASAAKDWNRAEAEFRAVIAQQPRNAAAVNNIAWLLATQRKPGASAMAQRALELLPERAPLLDTLSLAQESENQLDKALDTQQQAVKLDPRDPMLRLRLSRLLVQQGKKSDARPHLEMLAKLGTGFAGHVEVQDLLKAL